MNRRSFLQRMGIGLASAALQSHMIFKELIPVPELVIEKVNHFHGSFAQLLAPGLRQVFLKWLQTNPVIVTPFLDAVDEYEVRYQLCRR